ncbi:unnamed protein product [Linum tenue]|uniref:Serine/threonine-protein kinase 19 n=1 Tax=Linum tenue TaxID=586396 RepID=A0AAV0LKQ3_9ROSI|nr:unnamed protein product [Linum tenue]
MGDKSESSGSRKRRRDEADEEEEKTEAAGDADEAPSLGKCRLSSYFISPVFVSEALMFPLNPVVLLLFLGQAKKTALCLAIRWSRFVSCELSSLALTRLRLSLSFCARNYTTLKRENMLRIFKLNTGQDDHAIMFLEDYLNQHVSFNRSMQIERVTKRLEENKKSDTEVLEWFKKYVIDCKLEPSIDHQELKKMNLSAKCNNIFVFSPIYRNLVCLVAFGMLSIRDRFTVLLLPLQCLLLSNGGKVKDEHISLLINGGLLTRQLIDPNMYWFAIPNIGSILKGLSQGRKELLSLLKRRRYKEMMLAPLEKKRLRFSPLDIRFHLRDLIGSGHLKTLCTPTGLVVRVSKD